MEFLNSIPKAQRKLFSESKYREINYNGILMKTYSWEGERPVLCIHGSNGYAAQFSAIIKSLIANGYSPVVVDIPSNDEDGCFLPTKSIGTYLLELSKVFGDFFCVICHSMGCNWSLWAMNHGLKTNKLVCLSPIANQEFILNKFLEKYEGEKVELLKKIGDSFGENWMAELSNINLCKKIKITSLIFHDTSDSYVPANEGGEKLSLLWPMSRLELTSGLGHTGSLRDNFVISKIISYLMH